jgi:hypothetical protein
MISFFASESYVGRSYSRNQKELVTRNVSSRIRAEEMSAYLGAKLNPKDGYDKDVCIHVKPRDFSKVRDGDWVDILDGSNLIYSLRSRPKVKVISASTCQYEYLKLILPNELVLIPSHHVNHDNVRRERTEICIGGYTGVPSPAGFALYEDIAKRIKPSGFDFKTCWDYKTRQDAVNFYKNIDVFIYAEWIGGDSPFKIPTKMMNAGSFGVPAISISEKDLQGNKEIEGYYTRINNVNMLPSVIGKFKDPVYYKEMSDRALKKSEDYHISKIAELYKKLT